MRISQFLTFLCFCFGCFVMWSLPVVAKPFTVVIDAGHGGHDAGAVGSRAKEKNINLEVALAVGRLLENSGEGIQVLYTRKTDVFVTLQGRAQIANKNKADLFVSIHTNALPKGRIARGTETYTLGMHRTQENLEVAKKENAVIVMESDHETRYAGFNPNSAESYIMFEFMQDKNMSQSVALAALVQEQFAKTAGRADRGVRQAGFLVLHATSMPSVLIELGYISTPDEERYLTSPEGVRALSRSISNAVIQYKHKQRHTSAAAPPTSQATYAPNPTPQTPSQPSPQDNYIFKVQILTSSTPLNSNDPRLKGLNAVSHYYENGLYKYTVGATADYNAIQRTRRDLQARFKDAFIIAFQGEKKVNVQEAIAAFKQKR